MAGGIEVGNIDISGFGEFADLIFIAADEGCHGAFGGEAGLFHECAAFADDAQAIFK